MDCLPFSLSQYIYTGLSKKLPPGAAALCCCSLIV
jgi:hypothetical protein